MREAQPDKADKLDNQPIQIVEIQMLIPGIKTGKNPHKGLDSNEFSYNNADISSPLIWPLRNENGRNIIAEFFKPFKNQTVVDIGSGATANGYILAGFAEAKAFVAVEPNEEALEDLRGDLLYANEAKGSLKKLNKPLIPVSLVNDDGRSFLKRLPDQSVSIFTSGINETIIHGNPQHIKDIEAEIARVLHPEGAYINHYSAFSLNPSGFDEIEMPQKQKKELGVDYDRLTKYIRKSST